MTGNTEGRAVVSRKPSRSSAALGRSSACHILLAGDCRKSKPSAKTTLIDPRGHTGNFTREHQRPKSPGSTRDRKESTLFQGKSGKVWNRYVSPVPVRPGEGPLTEPTAATQPWRRLPPPSRHDERRRRDLIEIRLNKTAGHSPGYEIFIEALAAIAST